MALWRKRPETPVDQRSLPVRLSMTNSDRLSMACGTSHAASGVASTSASKRARVGLGDLRPGLIEHRRPEIGASHLFQDDVDHFEHRDGLLVAEIEGPDSPAIQAAAAALDLDWEARCAESYLGLFSLLRATQGLDAQNLTFKEVKQKYSAESFGLKAAEL